jgi:hypothetical protein
MKKFTGALILVFAMFTLAAAEEFGAVVTKFEDGKVTFKKFKKGEKAGEPTTLAVADKCKFMKAKFNKEEMKVETDGELEGGKDAFAKRVKEAAAKKPDDNADKKKKFGGFGGVFTTIVTEGEGDSAKVTEIRVFPAFGKKKDAN